MPSTWDLQRRRQSFALSYNYDRVLTLNIHEHFAFIGIDEKDDWPFWRESTSICANICLRVKKFLMVLHIYWNNAVVYRLKLLCIGAYAFFN